MKEATPEELKKLLEQFQSGIVFSSKQVELIMKVIDDVIKEKEEHIKQTEEIINSLYDLKEKFSDELF